MIHKVGKKSGSEQHGCPSGSSIGAMIAAWIAIMISLVSVYYTYRQSEITRINNLPSIDITETLHQGNDATFSSSITVKNTGGPVKDLRIDAVSVIRVAATLPSWSGLWEIPITGYYFPPTFTGRSKDIVARLGNMGNYDKIHRLIMKSLDVKYSNSQLIPADVTTYLKTDYSDALGYQHIEYYTSRPGLDMQPMTARQWEAIFLKSKETAIDIHKMSPEELIRIFSEMMAKRSAPTHFQWMQ